MFFKLLQRRKEKQIRVGWVTAETFPRMMRKNFSQLQPFIKMRTGNIAEWINKESDIFHNELYDRRRLYDIVVFQKMMDQQCQEEAVRIRSYGGKFIFDSNVNYYEIFGDYFIPGTKPTEAQQREAIWMTTAADWVVADSSYIARIVRKFNPRVTWIPDNVDLRVYSGVKKHEARQPVTLVWSGMSSKAHHILAITDALAKLYGVELVLVSDRVPDAMREIEKVVPCRFVPFSETIYSRTLLRSDILISPKRLCNGYDLGHTEYKITLGMAVGLPVVASPQESYVEALSHNGGGIIAKTEEEWFAALSLLSADCRLREEMGLRARQTVIERYSTPVVAGQYLEIMGMEKSLK